MARLYAVFDTNVYMATQPDAFARIVAAEAKCGVAGLASRIVIDELLARLSGSNPDFGPARASLKRLESHCSVANAQEKFFELRTAPDVRLQLAYSLFSHKMQDPAQENSARAFAIREIGLGRVRDEWHEKVRGLTQFMAERSETIKQSFRQMSWGLVRALVPDAQQWNDVLRSADLRRQLLEQIREGRSLPYVARSFVILAASETGSTYDEPALSEADHVVLKHFPVPVYCYEAVIEKLLRNGVGPDGKRANFVFDIFFSAMAVRGGRSSGAPVWLVTQDKVIRTAAARAGMSWYVRAFDEYVTLLGHGDEAISFELAREDSGI